MNNETLINTMDSLLIRVSDFMKDNPNGKIGERVVKHIEKTKIRLLSHIGTNTNEEDSIMNSEGNKIANISPELIKEMTEDTQIGIKDLIRKSSFFTRGKLAEQLAEAEIENLKDIYKLRHKAREESFSEVLAKFRIEADKRIKIAEKDRAEFLTKLVDDFFKFWKDFSIKATQNALLDMEKHLAEVDNINLNDENKKRMKEIIIKNTELHLKSLEDASITQYINNFLSSNPLYK